MVEGDQRATLDVDSVSSLPKSTLPPVAETFDPEGDVTLICYKLCNQSVLISGNAAHNTHNPNKRPKTSTTPQALYCAREVRFQVSSKHLSLNSPVFKAMLGSGFKEATALQSNGKVEIPLPEDCHEALKVILNAIYGKSHLLPTAPTPKLLSNIAMVLDKYRFPPIFKHFKALWFDETHHEPSNGSDRNMLSFFGACFVLGCGEDYLQEQFRFVWTEFRGVDFQDLQSRKSFKNDLPLPPVPETFLELLEDTRTQAIAESFQLIDRVIKEFVGEGFSTWGCDNSCDMRHYHDNTCDAILLRSLLQCTTGNGLWPNPLPPPYLNLSFSDVRERFTKMVLEVEGCEAGYNCLRKLEEELEIIQDRFSYQKWSVSDTMTVTRG